MSTRVPLVMTCLGGVVTLTTTVYSYVTGDVSGYVCSAAASGAGLLVGGVSMLCSRRTPWSLVAIASPPYLASEAESIDITYQLVSPDQVTEVRFRVTDSRGTLLLDRALTMLERGAQSVTWNGRIDAHPDFPDDFVTIQYSPYTVEIRASDGGRQETQQTQVHVEFLDITLSLGPTDVILSERRRAAVVEMGALPGQGATARVHLRSNIFSAGFQDKGHGDDTSFRRYAELWGNGPVIPLVATVKVRAASNVDGLPAPRALGRARVVWECEDVSDHARGLAERPASFVADAADYQVGTARPRGRGCHLDRGGKRGANGGGALLPPSASWGDVIDTARFPYDAQSGGARTWALMGRIEPPGPRRSQSGVIFRPSRIAGDAFEVHAYFDAQRTLDDAGTLDVRASHRTRTGTIEVWRAVDIARVYVKPGVAAFNRDEVRAAYARAHIRIDWDGVARTFNEGRYNTAFRNAIANLDTTDNDGLVLARAHAIERPDNQFSGTQAAMRLRTRDVFEESCVRDATAKPKVVEEAKHARYDVHGVDWKARQAAAAERLEGAVRARIAQAYTARMQMPNETADQLYVRLCEELACDVMNAACTELMATEEGVTEGIFVFGFAWTASILNAETAKTLGFAVRRDGVQDPVTAGYLQIAPAGSYVGEHSLTKTVVHEIGHLLFLPHPAQAGDPQDPHAHDAADDACTMSYHHSVEKHFCGYCLLRLRGWNHTVLAAGNAGDPRPNAQRPGISAAPPGAYVNAGGTMQGDLVITNTGRAPLVVRDARLATNNAFVLAPLGGPVTIAPLATHNLQVSFPAAAAALATITNTVIITSNASPASVSVLVQSNAQAAQLAAAPNPLQLPGTYVGHQSAAQQIRLSTLTRCRVTRVTLGGVDASQLRLAPLALPRDLAPGNDLDVSIVFAPTADGPKQALVLVESDTGTPLSVPVRGQAHVDIRYTVTAAGAFRFVPGRAERRTFTVRSIGAVPLKFLGIRHDNVIATDQITLGVVPAGRTLGNGETLTFDVIYTPPRRIDQNVRHRLNFDTNAPVEVECIIDI